MKHLRRCRTLCTVEKWRYNLGTKAQSPAHYGLFQFELTHLYSFQVLQKLLKYYLQKRDKLLLFSLSTKVRALFVWVPCVYLNHGILNFCVPVTLYMWVQRYVAWTLDKQHGKMFSCTKMIWCSQWCNPKEILYGVRVGAQSVLEFYSQSHPFSLSPQQQAWTHTLNCHCC